MKMVVGGAWVWVRPWFNKRFQASGVCARCRRASCAPGWHHIRTGEFRCRKCTPDEIPAWARRGTPSGP